MAKNKFKPLMRHEWPQNWPTLLIEYIQKAGRDPFQYGTNDCALFASNWVRKITGSDPAYKFRDQYTNEMGSYMALKKYGTGRLDTTFDEYFERGIVRNARRGDICSHVPDGDRDLMVMGIIADGNGVFLSEQGLTTLPVIHIKEVWKVG
tara:strand:+ start:937 stop:1386 length:450 start_codon:yes stop_codon:yes gene_type:complete